MENIKIALALILAVFLVCLAFYLIIRRKKLREKGKAILTSILLLLGCLEGALILYPDIPATGASTFGYTGTETDSAYVQAGYGMFSLFTLTEDAIITKLSCYGRDYSAGVPGTAKGAIYDVEPDPYDPEDLQWNGTELDLPTEVDWVNWTVPNVELSAGKYWLGWVIWSGWARLHKHTGAANQGIAGQGGMKANGDCTDPFPENPTRTAVEFCVFATYTPAGPPESEVTLQNPADNATVEPNENVDFNYTPICYYGDIQNTSLMVKPSGGFWTTKKWNSTAVANNTVNTIEANLTKTKMYLWKIRMFNSTDAVDSETRKIYVYVIINGTDYDGGWIDNSGTVYATVRNAMSGTTHTTSMIIGQKFASPDYFIYRGYIMFNTTGIANIGSALLQLYVYSVEGATSYNITVQNGQPTYPHKPLQAGDYARGNYSGDGGTIDASTLTQGQFNEISLNTSWINLTGWTKLCLRSTKDIDGTAPTETERITSYTASNGEKPKLYLTIDNDPPEIELDYWLGRYMNKVHAGDSHKFTSAAFYGREGSYVNGSRQVNDWIYINASVLDESPISKVWCEWYNGSWQNLTMSPLIGSWYGINITNQPTHPNCTFNLYGNDTHNNRAKIYEWLYVDADNLWPEQDPRKYVGLNYTAATISYDQLYLHAYNYSIGAAYVFSHEQSPDGSLTDTGVLTDGKPTEPEEINCTGYWGCYWDKTVTIPNGITIDNLYFHVWWCGLDSFSWDYEEYKYLTAEGLEDFSVSEETSRTNITNINFTFYETYYLSAHYWDINESKAWFDSTKIYWFAFKGGGLSGISTPWAASFVILNLPDNATLQGYDSDSDTWSDWQELYFNFTDPFDQDTDDDNLNDNVDPDPLHDQPPQWYEHAVNTTAAGHGCEFKVNCTDTVGLHGYILSHNNSDVWQNESWIEFSGNPKQAWAINELTLNSTVYQTVGYKWYLNDTSRGWNETDIFTLETSPVTSLTQSPPYNNVTVTLLDLEKTLGQVNASLNWNNINWTIFVYEAANGTRYPFFYGQTLNANVQVTAGTRFYVWCTDTSAEWTHYYP